MVLLAHIMCAHTALDGGLSQAVPEVVLVGQLSRKVLGERMHGHLHPSWRREHTQTGKDPLGTAAELPSRCAWAAHRMHGS